MNLVGVAIPAHNEEAVLPICLHSLLEQEFDGFLKVVVVANGCEDQSANIARNFVGRFEADGHELLIVETRKLGKANALNLADRQLRKIEMRLYMDADVTPSANLVSECVAALQPGTGVYLCSPKKLIESPVSWVSRSFARIWQNSSVVKDDVLGAGILAMNLCGRQRWGALPDVIADDGFMVSWFAPSERAVLRNATATLSLPEGFVAMLNVCARWDRGGIQLRRDFPFLPYTQRSASFRLCDALRHASLLDVLVYVLVRAGSRVLAHQRYWKKRQKWERAER